MLATNFSGIALHYGDVDINNTCIATDLIHCSKGIKWVAVVAL